MHSLNEGVSHDTTISTSGSHQTKTASEGPVAAAITKKLALAFGPLHHFALVDESHKHAGHSGMEGANRKTETHFKVTIVSEAFEGKALIARHRAVNECLE